MGDPGPADGSQQPAAGGAPSAQSAVVGGQGAAAVEGQGAAAVEQPSADVLQNPPWPAAEAPSAHSAALATASEGALTTAVSTSGPKRRSDSSVVGGRPNLSDETFDEPGKLG